MNPRNKEFKYLKYVISQRRMPEDENIPFGQI